MSKYNYTYEEYSQDTRSYTVESDVKLTREEIQDMALSCSMVEGATYKSKNSIATFKGTEFGDDSQTEFGGDEIKEEDEQASGPTNGQDLSWPLALAQGPRTKLQGPSGKLQAPSSKLDKTTL